VATPDEIALAEALLAEWDEGRGTSKSQIEIRVWDDPTSHGRRFDRFIRRTLGVPTNRPSKQSDRVAELKRQVRQLGGIPAGTRLKEWEIQLDNARAACLAALRAWNDPTSSFRTSAFSLLFIAAWNGLALAMLQKAGTEWRELTSTGKPVVVDGREKALTTGELVAAALPEQTHRGLRMNVEFWLGLRNQVAHRHLPPLDVLIIPQAQAGLLNFENVLAEKFGSDFVLGEALSIPLQLSGFRDPGVLASVRRLQSSLPLDVQTFLSDVTKDDPDLGADPTFMLRVAFVPAVPASGRNPDAVAYFVRPGEVPDDLAELINQHAVVPKVSRTPRPNLSAKQVIAAVCDQIPWRFTTTMHTKVSRDLGVRPKTSSGDQSVTDGRFCEYVPAAKLHLYNQAWIDRLVEALKTEDEFRTTLGVDPIARPTEPADP